MRALTAAAVVMALVALVEPLREFLFDVTPLTWRHRAIAAYTQLLPNPGDTADLEPMAHIGGSPYAINVFLEQEVEEAKVRRSLELIKGAGFGWIKQQLVWAEVEAAGKGQFAASGWAKYDRIVDLAREHGLDVILRIDTSPAWARPGNPKHETPPARFDDYGDFVASVAERYRGRVRHYQVWNEPNIPFEWGGAAPDAAAYTRLLWTARWRIRAADPDAVVISAAMAPTTEWSEHGLNDLRYLQAMYDAGVRGAFDILGANAYGLRSGPDDRRLAVDSDVNFSRPILTRRVMVRNGDAGRPIWAAEVGWNAVPEGSGIPDLWGRVDRGTQAAYTARAYARAASEWPWMGVLSLWHFRLVDPNAQRLPQYYFNVVDEQFTPQPVYHAMRELTRRPRAMQRGYRQEDDSSIVYDGAWVERRDGRAVVGRYRESRGAAGFSLAFDGTELTLVVGRQPSAGSLRIAIDGVELGVFATSSFDEEWRVELPVARGLSDGRHLLEVEATGPVRVDGVIVDRRRGWPGLLPEGLLLLLGVLAVGSAVVRARAA